MLGNDHHANHEDVLGQHGGIFAVRGLCKTGKPCPVQGYCHKDTKHVSEIPKCQYKGHISEQWYNGKEEEDYTRKVLCILSHPQVAEERG